MATNVTGNTVDQMNGLLRGELSALETYRQALEKVEDRTAKDVLKECHMCHSKRVDSLVEKIVALGGKPADDSGAWGSFAKLMEGGAAAFGDKSAIAMLEEGEDKGLRDYKKLLDDSDLRLRELASSLVSAQEGTHGKMRNLKLLMK